LIAVTLSVMGLALAAADRWGSKTIPFHEVNWSKALTIGVCQAFALIPGVSRSGVTMTTGLFLGLEKTAAVRYSFLLSIPITMGAGLLKIHYLVDNIGNPEFLAGLITSAVSGFLAIHFLLTYVRSRSFTPFVVYRLALAAAIAIKLLSS
jgi:undecaprenyl-diphosphatase